ncbi:hypothetical protein PAXINDRAFT_162195 [Paxillus involutus ATCC 200175]|nr:hypothetical protein PAXINDRAFT_162195 [Paxillus involutus ATCC 200175]
MLMKFVEPTSVQSFQRAVETVKKFDIKQHNTYGVDEMGCQPAGGEREYVIGAWKTGPQYQQRSGSRENITNIVTICTDGTATSPAVIFKELRLGYSKKGWTTGEIGVTWIQEFDKQTSQKASGKYHLLLVDGHNSHYTRGFLDEARDEWERSTGQSINKKNFLAVYGPAHLKTLTCENICTAFWKTGVWPSNPHVITSGMMAPNKETSIQGSLPVESATPIKLLSPSARSDNSYTRSSTPQPLFSQLGRRSSVSFIGL